MILFLFLAFFTYISREDSSQSIINWETSQDEATEAYSIPIDTKCYKGIGFTKVFLSTRSNSKITNLPIFLTMDLSIIFRDLEQKQTKINNFKVYLVQIHEKCEKTFIITDANTNFHTLIIRTNFYTNTEILDSVSQHEAFLTRETPNGLYLFDDLMGFICIYIYYKTSQNEIPNEVVLPSIDILKDQLKLFDFNSMYICISQNLKHLTIRADFGAISSNIPIYKSLTIRLYSNERSVYFERVSAWPCSDGYLDFESNKPRLVIGDYLEDYDIIWSFDAIDDDNDAVAISWNGLNKIAHFRTTSPVWRLSERDSWLSVNDAIFLVEKQKEYILCSSELKISNTYSKDGFKNLESRKDFSSVDAKKHIQISQRLASDTQYCEDSSNS